MNKEIGEILDWTCGQRACSFSLFGSTKFMPWPTGPTQQQQQQQKKLPKSGG